MQRLPDWRARLGAHIAAHRTRPFAYGAHDCATFAAGAVQAVTGSDPAAGLTGYTTRAGGLRRLRRNGLEDHVAFVASRFAEIPVACAQQGDLAVIEAAGGLSLGVVCGAFVLAPTRPSGLAVVPLTPTAVGGHILRAFRV
jgi:hypothetical protein